MKVMVSKQTFRGVGWIPTRNKKLRNKVLSAVPELGKDTRLYTTAWGVDKDGRPQYNGVKNRELRVAAVRATGEGETVIGRFTIPLSEKEWGLLL